MPSNYSGVNKVKQKTSNFSIEIQIRNFEGIWESKFAGPSVQVLFTSHIVRSSCIAIFLAICVTLGVFAIEMEHVHQQANSLKEWSSLTIFKRVQLLSKKM
ncbi:hypothetical protein BDR05DRAFT_953189 [Suillus weaverae]|nr:hypothetical protein BDR05DRAFT_953189 [Suillus weaverae]